MRSNLVAALVSVLAACGEGATARVKAPAPEVASAHVVVPAAAVAMEAPVSGGAPSTERALEPALESSRPLDGADRLTHLFQRLAALDDGSAHDDVRIVQYGDSHTAADMGTGAFRKHMQARFGDGGRGFVSIGRPWTSYVQDGIHGYMSEEFEPVRMYVKDQRGSGDGFYGLLGVGIGADAPGAVAWSTVAPRSSHVEIDYLCQPGGGSFDVLIDGARAGRVATRTPQATSGYASYETSDGPHQVQVRAVGDGDVRVFGMTLDRSEAGVVVDALGINGAQIFTALRWNEAHFAEQLRHRAPDLVVLAYGTNEALEPRLQDADYERALVDLLGRVSRAAPESACMLLGPPDLARWTKGTRGYHTWPRVLEIAAIQRRVAKAAGCAFYDQIDAMGGPGSIAAWADEAEPRAQQDRVHLTRAGYTQVGTMLATDVLHAYDAWRASKGLPPSGTKPLDVARR